MSELEKCCGLVIAAGLATGHADTHIELMEEVLAQCINAGPNVRAQAKRIAELEASRALCHKYAGCVEGNCLLDGDECAAQPPQEQSDE